MRASHGVLVGLIKPIYLPSFVYSLGTGAMIAGQVLLGLKLGFGSVWLSSVIAATGLGGMFGSLFGGWVVQRFGERRGLTTTTVACAAVLALTTVAVWVQWPGLKTLFIVALLISALLDGVWAVARQSLVAELVPNSHRGRAMNLYGAAQRLGRMTGPLIAAVLFAVTGPEVVCLAHAVLALVAVVILVRSMPSPARRGDGIRAVESAPPAVRPLAAFIGVGLAMAALNALRTNRDLLIPLWGDQVTRLADERIALVMALGVALELVLFLPAGWVSDRYGPTLVAATCLILMTVGFAVLLLPGTGATGYVTAAALIGLGNGLGSGIVKLLGVTLAPAPSRALFLGRWVALVSAGSVVGPALIAFGAAIGGPPASVMLTVALGVVATIWLLCLGRPMIARARRALAPVDPV